MTPSAEEFARWRDDSVTRWVFKALEKRTEDQREIWLSRSWVGGLADQPALLELRTRASAFIEIIDAHYEEWCLAIGEEPIHD